LTQTNPKKGLIEEKKTHQLENLTYLARDRSPWLLPVAVVGQVDAAWLHRDGSVAVVGVAVVGVCWSWAGRGLFGFGGRERSGGGGAGGEAEGGGG